MTPQQKKQIIERNLVRFMEACKMTDIQIFFKMEDGGNSGMGLFSATVNKELNPAINMVAQIVTDAMIKATGVDPRKTFTSDLNPQDN